MPGRPLALVAALLVTAPTAAAAPGSACPMNSASGWSAVSASGWELTPQGSVYTTAPQFVQAEWDAFFAAMDTDGDDVVCLSIGVLPRGTPPFVWEGYAPISVIDDAIRGRG